MMGEGHKVVEYCRLQAKLAEETGQNYLLAVACFNLGNIALAEKDIDMAERYFTKDMMICRKLGHRLGESVAMGALSTTLCYRGMYEKAYEYAVFFVTVSRILGNRYRELSALVDLMFVQMYTDELEEAGKTLELRISIAGKMNMTDAVAENFFFQAILELLKEKFGQALLLVQKAIAFSEENDISLNPVHYCVAGVLHTLSGDTSTGKDYLKKVDGLLKLNTLPGTGLLDGFAAALKETDYSSSVDLVLRVVDKHNSA
jgi:tetratricopeptide (TPR) repeat protein